MARNYKVTRHVCPRNCYSSCAMLGYTRNGRLLKVTGDKKHGYTKGKLCPKGYNYLSHVYHPERLRYPMMQLGKGSGKWIRISWEEAIERISQKIIELYDRYGSNQSLALNKYSGNFGLLHNSVEGFFNSLGQTSRAIGSPCWSAGLDASIYDFGNYRNSDPGQLRYADTIILWGSNPVWTSIHSVHYLYEAKKRGATLITIDPVYTATAEKSDIYVQINPGTDGAMALALMKTIVEKEGIDKTFIQNHTVGFERFKKYLLSLKTDRLLKECGLSYGVIDKIADIFIAGGRAIAWIGFGFQRNENGGQSVRAVNALMAMTGNIGRKGSGVLYAQKAGMKFSEQITNCYQPGYNEKNSVRSIPINDFAYALQEMKDPPVQMLWIACRNLIVQSPDQKQLKKILLDLEFVVTVDQFMTATAQLSDIVLPATTNFEEWDIVPSYWHQWVGMNEPAIEPYFESKSDLEIVQLLARRLNELRPGFSTFPYEKTVEEFIDEEFTAELYEKMRISHWRELLSGPRPIQMPAVAWEDKAFETPSGKYEFYSERALHNGKQPMAHYTFQTIEEDKEQFLLLSNHEPFSLNSQFQNLGLLQKEPIAYIHPSCAEKKGITNGSWIHVHNEHGHIQLKCICSQKIHPSVILLQANHDVVNKLISFIPTDMGEEATGSEGMAFNSTYVSVELVKQT